MVQQVFKVMQEELVILELLEIPEQQEGMETLVLKVAMD